MNFLMKVFGPHLEKWKKQIKLFNYLVIEMIIKNFSSQKPLSILPTQIVLDRSNRLFWELSTCFSLEPLATFMFWIIATGFSARAPESSFRIGCSTSANCACPSSSSPSAPCFFKISFSRGNSVWMHNIRVRIGYYKDWNKGIVPIIEVKQVLTRIKNYSVIRISNHEMDYLVQKQCILVCQNNSEK